MELVCPAGNLPALKTAVDHGADAVYIGLRDDTSARHFAGPNFNDKQAAEGIRYAHSRQARVFVAINTYPQPAGRPRWTRPPSFASIPRYWPTSASWTMPPDSSPVPLEAFGFGSLCVMGEGRCLLSSYVTGRSPNTSGACSPASAVRWQETECGMEAGSELGGLRRLREERDVMVEANDMTAVQLLAGRKPFVTGPAVNIYNARTLSLLAGLGMKRWVLPLEFSRNTLADLQATRPERVETEVFAYGRLPLAYSARCFTARAHNLPKDDCQFRCLDYPYGLLLSTRDDTPFLVLNGIQTQSALTLNLIAELDDLAGLGVDVLRISPQSQQTEFIIETFHTCLQGNLGVSEARAALDVCPPVGECDGYWHGHAGMNYSGHTANRHVE